MLKRNLKMIGRFFIFLGIDPRVMIYDLSNDTIKFSIDRFKLNNMLMKELKNKFLNEGSTYEDLRRGFYILNSSSSTAGNGISRFICLPNDQNSL